MFFLDCMGEHIDFSSIKLIHLEVIKSLSVVEDEGYLKTKNKGIQFRRYAVGN